MKAVIITILFIFSPFSVALESDCSGSEEKYRKKIDNLLKSRDIGSKIKLIELQKIEISLNQLLEECEGNVNIASLLISLNLNSGKNETAELIGQMVVEKNPESWLAHFDYGGVLTLRYEFDKGLIHLEKAEYLNPDNVYVKFRLCSNYEMAKLYKKAVKKCNEVIDSEDDKVLGPAVYVRARAYDAMGMSEKALADYRYAKKLGFNGAPYYSERHLGKK